MIDVRSWPGVSTRQLAAFGPTWQTIAWRNLVFIGASQGVAAPLRTSALTAKFAWGGEERYELMGRPLLADDDAWAVIGAGEPYSSAIPKGGTVRTLAVFFDEDFVSAVRSERVAKTLDPVEASVPEPLPLGRRRLAYDGTLARLVGDAMVAPPDDAVHEELLHVSLDRILSHAAAVPEEWDRLDCVRLSTRVEIHRRLARAYDFLASAYDRPLVLGDVAHVAAMAPHQFLSRFREAFGVTPHQLLIQRRLARARWLLVHTNEPVGRIARAVGLASLGSFSARFAREVGLSPRAYRAKFGTSEKSRRQAAR
jgi:AraC-like DNA-binding protein